MSDRQGIDDRVASSISARGQPQTFAGGAFHVRSWGKPEEIGGKAEIGVRMAEAEGTPDVNRTWPSGPGLAEAVEELG